MLFLYTGLLLFAVLCCFFVDILGALSLYGFPSLGVPNSLQGESLSSTRKPSIAMEESWMFTVLFWICLVSLALPVHFPGTYWIQTSRKVIPVPTQLSFRLQEDILIGALWGDDTCFKSSCLQTSCPNPLPDWLSEGYKLLSQTTKKNVENRLEQNCPCPKPVQEDN